MPLTKLSLTRRVIMIVCFIILPSAVFGSNPEYSVGHGALDIFNGEGFTATPRWVQIWVMILMGIFVSGFYFAWKHPLARLAIAGFILSLSLGQALFRFLDLPFLGGSIAIMHLVCWSPALFALLWKRPFMKADERIGFRIWSGLMVSTLVFSFVFDLRDAVIYINYVTSITKG